MIFTVSSGKLQKKLISVSGALGSNGTLPILESFLFVVEDGELTISATDLETFKTNKLDVMSDSDGAIVIPAKILIDVLKALPEQPLSFHIDMDTSVISIMSQTGKYKLIGEPSGDFPDLPELDEDAQIITIPARVFQEAISKCLLAVGNDEFRPAMMGVYFKINNNTVTFVATDAHKLIKYTNKNIASNISNDVILPKKVLSLLKSEIANRDVELEISIDESNVFFKVLDVLMVGRLIDAKYPDYEAVIPDDNHISVCLNKQDFQSALKRLAIFSNQTTHQVNFHVRPHEMELNSKNLDFDNEATEKIDCELIGDDSMEIAFNAKFLGLTLGAIDTEDVLLSLSEPNRAGLLKPATQDDNADVTILLMPIMLGY